MTNRRTSFCFGISHRYFTHLFLLVEVKLLEAWHNASLIFIACLPDLADTQPVEQMMPISSTSFGDLMIEGHRSIFKYSKGIIISIHSYSSTSFSKLGLELIDNYLWNAWVIWGNQVVTLSSQPECISGIDSVALSWFLFPWFPEALVSQERSLPFESGCDSCWVK